MKNTLAYYTIIKCFDDEKCTSLLLGNCDIDFFVFHHQFRITRLKFMKFESDQKAAGNFQIYINSINSTEQHVFNVYRGHH
jgi:hypothetical protein